MYLTFSEMQSRTRRHLGVGSSNSYYSTDDIKDAINDAIEEVAKETRSLLTYHEISMTADQDTYTLPSDVLQVAWVEWDKSSSERWLLQGVSFEEFADASYHNYSHSSDPKIYKVEFGSVDITSGNQAGRPGNLVLWPVPNTTDKLRLYSIQRPQKLTNDTDISELPAELHLSVTVYAAMLLAMKDSDMTRHNALARIYVRAIDSYKQLHNQRERNRKRPARRSTRRRVGENPRVML